MGPARVLPAGATGTVALLMSALAIVMTLAAVTGWFAGWPLLTSWLPGAVLAGGVAVASLAVWKLAPGRRGPARSGSHAAADRNGAEAFREAFAGILSHELRTPITSIHAAATLLMRAGLDDEQREELLVDVMEEAERLRHLVEDLVVLTRVERGTIQIHTEPVLLPHILRKVVERERLRWPDRRIEMAVDGSPPVAQAESAFVEQVVRCLVGNAAKYCPAGSRIDVLVDSDEGAPRVRVLDRGPGVDPAESALLFELFYRSARTAHMPGSGIGLFVAQRLVESMGGVIWCRPRDDGSGAEFGFRLLPQREEA
jgi:two-component system sensor histidine kinase KdpD